MNEIAGGAGGAEAFEQKVAGVPPEQRGNQSPCEKWSARDVVDHIVVPEDAPLQNKLLGFTGRQPYSGRRSGA